MSALVEEFNGALELETPTVVETDDVDEANTETVTLSRSLGMVDGLAVTVGLMIGSGIFASPGLVLLHTRSVFACLSAWVVSGCMALMGALCYAELGTCVQSAGGECAYFEEAFGPSVAFMFTFSAYFVIKCGSQAIISIVFARYVCGSLGWIDLRAANVDNDYRIKLIAILALFVLCCVNCSGVKHAAMVQKVFTALKLVAIFLVIVIGFVYIFIDHVAADNFGDFFTRHDFSDLHDDDNLRPSYGVGLIAALFAYDGFNAATYVSEELRDVEKLLPRIVMSSLPCVAILYSLVNAAYFCVLPVREVAASRAIAIEFAERALKGHWAGVVFAMLVACSAFGALNANIVVSGRTFFSAARQGLLPSRLAKLHPTRQTPVLAIVAACAWSALLLIPGSFSSLVEYFGVASWCFYGLAGVSLMVLRRKKPDLKRPMRVPMYPLTPVLLILSAAFLVINGLVSSFLPSLLAIAFVFLSLPVYWVVFKFGAWRRIQDSRFGRFLRRKPRGTSTAPDVQFGRLDEAQQQSTPADRDSGQTLSPISSLDGLLPHTLR